MGLGPAPLGAEGWLRVGWGIAVGGKRSPKISGVSSGAVKSSMNIDVGALLDGVIRSSRLGSCIVCHKRGEVRYFVAAKLPRYLYLCEEHYLRIRDRLEKALEAILREDGLI